MSDQEFASKASEVLKGDALNNALAFAKHLDENDMIAIGGSVIGEGKTLCYFHLDGSSDYPGPWTIWTDGECDYSAEHPDVPVSDEEKEIAWANANICASCGGSCSPGIQKVIFGKAFDNVCSSAMAFNNPDSKTLECVKKLLEMNLKA